MGKLKILSASTDDLDDMIALRARSFKEHYGDNTSLAPFKQNGEALTVLMEQTRDDDEIIRHRDNLAYKAVDEESKDLLGFIIYSMSGDDARLLQISAVKSDQRVGTKLIDFFKKDARDYGFRKIVAGPLPIAEAFYLKQGFTRPGGSDDFVLAL